MTDCVRLVSLLVFMSISLSSVSAENFSSLDTKQVSVNKIQAKIEETNASSSIDDAAKSTLIEMYLKTITFLEQTTTDNNSIQQYKEARKNARNKAEEILSQVEKRKQNQPEGNSKKYQNKSLSELDLMLITEKANLTAVSAKLDDLQRKQSFESDRPRVVGQILTDTQQRQQELETEFELLATSEEDLATHESKTWLMLSEYQELRTRIKMLDQELLSQPMRLELIQARIEESNFDLSLIKKNIEVLESIISNRRKSEAQVALSETEKALEEIDSSHEAVIKLAEANSELSIISSSIAERLEGIISTNNLVARDNTLLQEKLKRTRKQIEVAGLSQKLGNVLLKERRGLPGASEYLHDIKEFNSEIVNVMFAQIQHQDEKKQLKDSEAYIDDLLQAYNPKDHEQIRNELTPLIKTRLTLLQQAIELERTYILTMDELVATYQKMQDTVNVYKTLLDERLIWVRNFRIVDLDIFESISSDARRLFNFKPWFDSISVVIKSLGGSIWFILAVLIAILIKTKQNLIRKLIIDSGSNTYKPSRDRITYTLQALLLSIILALPLFLIASVASWEISYIDNASVHTSALSRALLVASIFWFYSHFMYNICIEKGLAENHFRWPEASLQLLRSVIPRLSFISCVLIFLFIIIFRLNDEDLGSAFGLLILVAFWVNFTYSMNRLLDPDKGVLSPLFLESIQSSGRKLDQFARVLATFFTSVLILFALLGYLYGTIIFSFAILLSLCFVSGALIVQQLLLRWLYVNHRRLALKTALEKRAETQQKAMEQEDPGKISIAEEFGEIAEEPELDLASIGQDSRVLLNVFILILALWGLWEIWSNVMPAFSVLDNIILWNNTLIVDGEEKFLPVTLGDFTFALLITFILIIVIQKLPALLEIILLQRLDISQGLRFTIKTLINYSLILVGILWVSNLIGISWAKIQWLVAALSLGIGFGLQEIIANFICGIIILFERPIRIGDVVTIGDTDGVVTRIQIRATTIRNWDRKELLVPNKEFITGRLLNWSLSDRVSRIKFPIGIAYGSDVDLAMKLVEEAAEENSNVLEEPAPYVSFEEFGDNSLLLYLRCFIEYNDNRVQTITDLHKVIDQKFRDADISISFPQRDIHLDTSTPLEINLRKDT